MFADCWKKRGNWQHGFAIIIFFLSKTYQLDINFTFITSSPQVDLRHKDELYDPRSKATDKTLPIVDIGIDLTEFYQSVEWDILSVPAQR